MPLYLTGKFIGLQKYYDSRELLSILNDLIKKYRDNILRIVILPSDTDYYLIMYYICLDDRIIFYIFDTTNKIVKPSIELLRQIFRKSRTGYLEIYLLTNEEYEIDKDSWSRLNIIQGYNSLGIPFKASDLPSLFGEYANIDTEKVNNNIIYDKALSNTLSDPHKLAEIILKKKYNTISIKIDELIETSMELFRRARKILLHIITAKSDLWIIKADKKIGIYPANITKLKNNKLSEILKDISNYVNKELGYSKELKIKINIYKLEDKDIAINNY